MKKKSCLLAVFCLLVTSLTLAQTKPGLMRTNVVKGAPTTCGPDPVLSSDGVVTTEDAIYNNTTAYYTLNVKDGHSYSIEVWDPFDLTAGVAPGIQVLASDCSTSIPVSNVTSMDPDLSGGFSSRVSWIQGSDQKVHIAVSNPDPTNTYTYYIRVTDTTLINPRWSTYVPYDTQWGLTNTSAVNITGTLSIVDVNGIVLKTIPLTLLPGRLTVITALTEGIPVNDSGNATFVFVGSPGAVMGDAYYLNPPTASTIVPSSFAGRHAYH